MGSTFDDKPGLPGVPLFRMPELLNGPQLPAAVDVKIFENPLITSMKANLASEFYKRLSEAIRRFDAELPEHEVGVRLVSFGQALTIRLTGIGCWNPSLIRFYGLLEDDSPVELIQHISQINVLLTRLPRKNGVKRKIGFLAEGEGQQP